MIKLQTKTYITLQQAVDFEIKQSIKYVRKTGFLSIENCKWLVAIEKPDFANGFRAVVTWYQLQSYKPDEKSEVTAIRQTQMFVEDFVLSKEQMELMFISVGLSIIPNEHSFSDRTTEIIGLGVKNWLENLNKVFGEGVEFEIL